MERSLNRREGRRPLAANTIPSFRWESSWRLNEVEKFAQAYTAHKAEQPWYDPRNFPCSFLPFKRSGGKVGRVMEKIRVPECFWSVYFKGADVGEKQVLSTSDCASAVTSPSVGLWQPTWRVVKDPEVSKHVPLVTGLFVVQRDG